jgi:hypothetical protein
MPTIHSTGCGEITAAPVSSSVTPKIIRTKNEKTADQNYTCGKKNSLN